MECKLHQTNYRITRKATYLVVESREEDKLTLNIKKKQIHNNYKNTVTLMLLKMQTDVNKYNV